MTSTYKMDKLAADNAAKMQEWFQCNPTVVACTANEKMLRYYLDFSEPLELVDFDFAKTQLGNQLATANIPTVEDVNAAEEKHRKQLKLPAVNEQVRRIIKNGEELPQEWYGRNIGTPENLRALARSDFPLFKRLVDRYGSHVVDARMGATKQPQQVGSSASFKF
jgi:hypothetical protein